MGIIAVAGGMGQVGQAIVKGLVKHGHTVIALSRSASDPRDGYTIAAADYNDIEATTKLLQDNNVDKLVCAIGVVDEKTSKSQLNLIRAAEQSTCTRRFVIGSYDLEHKLHHVETHALSRHVFEAIEALEQTNLDFTRIVNGWFLDYFGMPHWDTPLHPWINIMSMQGKWAVVPGDGSAKATFITTQDLGRFLGKLMDAPKWEKISRIAGNEMRFDELIELAQEIRGCKFEVAYDSLEKLDSGKISFADRFPSIGQGSAAADEAFFARIHYLAGSGDYLVDPDEATLNAQFPDIQLTSCEEVMRTSWEGKE